MEDWQEGGSGKEKAGRALAASGGQNARRGGLSFIVWRNPQFAGRNKALGESLGGKAINNGVCPAQGNVPFANRERGEGFLGGEDGEGKGVVLTGG